MDIKSIINVADKMKETFSTSDPFQIAHELGIKIQYTKANKKVITGYTVSTMVSAPTIIINQLFDYRSQKIFCAHELGHAILHKEDAINHFADTVSSERERQEYEANLFAVTLLFNPDEFDTNPTNMSNYVLKSLLDYNVNYK